MKKYFLTIIAIFKNESTILAEWLEHYLLEGVDHFYLIDNDSNDQYTSQVDPYLKDQSVEIVKDPRPHLQVEHYNNYFLAKAKAEAEWVMVVDFDEFIYSRGSFATVADYLRSLAPTVAQVYVPWKLFGSAGLLDQPKNCLESFTKRTLYNHKKTNGMIDNDHMLTKTLVRTKYLEKITIHYSIVAKTAGVTEITSDGKLVNEPPSPSKLIDENILQHSALHCNHYPLQSYKWFQQIKMTRGSASSVRNDTVRTVEYFNSFESHSCQINDLELANKRNRIKIYYGCDDYLDVTRICLKNFGGAPRPPSPLVIDNSIVLNHYFGDPQPGKEKYLVVRQGAKLTIYPETNHGTITIDRS